jgi:membrane protease YdiL (CAAX protease family)
VGVLVPIVEEFGIRGWIQHPLERRIGPARAIFLTSVIFAVAHFQLLGLPTRFFAGIFFGYAVWASRSIWAAVLLHAAHNLSLILPAAFARDDAPARDVQTAPLLITSAIGLALMALILTRIGARLRAECAPADPVTPSAAA